MEHLNDSELISTQELIEDSRTRRIMQYQGKGTKLKCDQCEWTSGSKTLMDKHTKIEHTTENIQEKIHNETENQDKNKNEKLNKQKQQMTKATTINSKSKYISKRIKCEKCEKMFNKKETFMKHMESYHKEISSIVTFLDNRRSLRSNKTRTEL